ncbi:hypothetical protein [Sorangium sp. So ce341]|uniref:hypothetical protein n=1 Tax=Sorangium sp. So ce341 TaxID=3133302 RepID=UPI003F636854
MRCSGSAVLHPRRLVAVAVLAGALAGSDARAEVQPLRITYEAHEGCPSPGVFLRELTARTSRARAAAPDEAALEVRVRITRSAGATRGRITLGAGEGARVREVGGATCAEVVAALALITALRVDPTASLDPQPPAAEPRSTEDPAPGGAADPAGGAATAGGAADPAGAARAAGAAEAAAGEAPGSSSPPRAVAPPPAAPPASPAQVARAAPAPARPPSPAARGSSGSPRQPLPEERRWTLGLHASAASGVTPIALLGGGPFLELRADVGVGVSLRGALELAATGAVDVGPGGASFTRGIGRLDACADLFRPARWLALAPCVGAEGGFLRGAGQVGEAIAEAKQATVPWASLGLLARATASLGARVRADLQGGPQLPLVRRSFVFESPAQLVHEVPAVTWTLHAGAGLSF